MVTDTYISYITEQINCVTEGCGPVLLYGENIANGSRLSGLARGLRVNPDGRILNVGNCELTHIGVGLGIMADGGKAVVFMKQLDFLLLGLDQVVNTLNYFRAAPPKNEIGSFTVYVIVCDQGYQGPQSSFNSASDIASIANVRVYCLNGCADASRVVYRQFVEPGFRVICVSQRHLARPALEIAAESFSPDCEIFKYRSGGDVTLVCYNFSLQAGLRLSIELSSQGVEADLFHVNYIPNMDISMIRESCARTKNLVLIDDSKSVNKFGEMLSAELRAGGLEFSSLSLFRRVCKDQEYGVNQDQFLIDFHAVHEFLEI